MKFDCDRFPIPQKDSSDDGEDEETKKLMAEINGQPDDDAEEGMNFIETGRKTSCNN